MFFLTTQPSFNTLFFSFRIGYFSKCSMQVLWSIGGFSQNYVLDIIRKNREGLFWGGLINLSMRLFWLKCWPFSKWIARWNTVGKRSWISNPRMRHTDSELLIYLPLIYVVILSFLFSSAKVAWSHPLFIYFHIYFIEFTEWQYFTLMWDLNVLKRTGL